MNDRIVKVLAADRTVLALAAVTTELVEEARRRHRTAPTATAALGRALTAACLLAATLETGERISLEFSGNGPLGGLLVDATPAGDDERMIEARGYAYRPQTDLPLRDGKLDVGGALGKGVLCVIRSASWSVRPYRSIVPLVTGEIAKDVTSYLATSEQIPSAVALGVFIDPSGCTCVAGGYMIQALPGASTSTLELLERNVSRLPVPTELLRGGAGAEDILAAVVAGMAVSPLERLRACWRCRCSRDRVHGAILAMGRAELIDMIERERRAEVTCEFCGRRYALGEEELRSLLVNSGNGGL